MINFIGVVRIFRVIVVIIFGRSVRDARVIITSYRIDGLKIAGIAVSQRLRNVLEQANSHHRPLDQRLSPNTRAAFRKPAL